MTFWLITAAATCAAFTLIALVSSMVVAWSAPAVARRTENQSPAARAGVLFRLRMLPGALAAIGAFAVVLPVFLEYEPRDTQESLGFSLMLLACAGGGLVIRGGWRAWRAWRATRRVLDDWRRRGRPLTSFDTALPVFAIEETFPTVAVVGVARPALFIAERVLRECTPDEVRAMLHHECAHVAKRDNLKRFLMRACPDVVGAELDREWSRAAEEAADAAAVASNPGFAVELAQALIRVARLAPSPQAPALASAFYLGGSIESRVRRLVQPTPSHDGNTRLARLACFATAVAAAAILAATAPTLHGVIESAIYYLP